MLSPEHQKLLRESAEEGDPFKLKDTVAEIREDLNPHPAGQKELNAPKKEEVSDILFTGGDPMFMKTKLFKQYFDPFKDPEFLPHVKNLRIGTRALTFWPQRFTTDDDAEELHTLLREVKELGGRHIAIMSHLGHVRELQTDKVREAIHKLRQEAGVNIRSQSPVMRGINDDGQIGPRSGVRRCAWASSRTICS